MLEMRDDITVEEGKRFFVRVLSILQANDNKLQEGEIDGCSDSVAGGNIGGLSNRRRDLQRVAETQWDS